jgi:hypothetical protein
LLLSTSIGDSDSATVRLERWVPVTTTVCVAPSGSGVGACACARELQSASAANAAGVTLAQGGTIGKRCMDLFLELSEWFDPVSRGRCRVATNIPAHA